MTILIITGLSLGFVISYLFVLFFRVAARIQKRYLAISGIVYYFSIIIGAIFLTNFIEGFRIFGITENKERTIFILLWGVPSVMTSVLSTFKYMKSKKTVDDGQGRIRT